MPPFNTVVVETLDDIVFDGAAKKPTRKLPTATAIGKVIIDISAQVDVAAGGGADGVVNVEHVERLVRSIRIFDGNNTPRLDAEARELLQFSKAYGMNPESGAGLAIPGIQAATLVRRQIVIPFSNPWSSDPYEVHLRPRDPDKFKIEIEWPGLEAVGAANGVLAAVLITGGTRSVVVTNLKVQVTVEHDPVAFLKRLPLYQPFITSYDKDAPAVNAKFPFEIETSRVVRATMIHALNADVTSEAMVNKLGLKDDQRQYLIDVPARTFHEFEQWRFGGVEDVTGVDLGYFIRDFAQNGKLSNCMSPRQGGNPRWVFDVTGGANRKLRLVQLELERTPGLTVPDSELPDGHFAK